MRIGMVTACYKPVVNGVTHMVSLYNKYLTRAGHDVTVFTWGDPDPDGEEPNVIRSPGIPLGEDGYYVNFRYSKEAQRRIQEMEIVHCHHLFMSLEMAHRYGNCPIVYTNHTRYDLYTGTYTPLPQPAADAIMRQIWPEYTDLCDVVITPSNSMRKVMTTFGVRQPIVVIENGVELEAFRRPPAPYDRLALKIPADAVLGIFVGRLAGEKKVDVLLEQFAIAQDIAPELFLLVVGDGQARRELETRVRELGLSDCVRFTGRVDYDDITNYLAAADFFVTASDTEVHPLTIIEAMAAGLPIVAVASPGIVDTVNSGRSGLLTHHSQGGLAAAMVAMAANASRRAEMSEAARAESERFAIDRTIDRTVELYEELRAKRPDLARNRLHGGSKRRFLPSTVEPLLEQLASLLGPPAPGGGGPSHP